MTSFAVTEQTRMDHRLPVHKCRADNAIAHNADISPDPD
jgi:hypothetical protein